MRRGLGILGLFIGLGTFLVFWYIPYIPAQEKSAEVLGGIDTREAIFIVSYVLWALFSTMVKLTMVLKKKIAFVNYTSPIIFIFSVAIGLSLYPKNGGGCTEFHLLHDVFAPALIFGWSTIDTVDLAMVSMKKW